MIVAGERKAADNRPMAKSNRGPALYELIADRGGRGERAPVTVHTRVPPARSSEPEARPEPASQPVPVEEAPSERLPVVLRPGHAVRMPVGYIWLAAAVIIAVGIGGYSIGFNQAQTQMEEQLEQRQQAEWASIKDPTLTPSETQTSRPRPSASEPAGLPTRSQPSAVGANRPARVSGPAGATTSAAGGARLVKVGPGDPDPRTEGLNYFVVCHWRVEEADAAAEFLASHGVAAARLLPNNRGLANVIALEGFTADELRSGRHRELEQEIKRLGRLYVQEHNGPGDFSDLYPQKY